MKKESKGDDGADDVSDLPEVDQKKYKWTFGTSALQSQNLPRTISSSNPPRFHFRWESVQVFPTEAFLGIVSFFLPFLRRLLIANGLIFNHREVSFNSSLFLLWKNITRSLLLLLPPPFWKSLRSDFISKSNFRENLDSASKTLPSCI